MTAPTAQTLRHSLDRRPGIIVVDAGDVPDWVRRWSDHSGRTVRTGPAEATFAAAHTGDSVLVLRADHFTAAYPRIVTALHGLPDDAAVLADAVDAAIHLGGSLTLVHGVPLSFGERSVGLHEALRRGEELLHDARALVDAASVNVPVDTKLVRAWPHELVGELLDADLLTIGGPRVDADDEIGLVAATALRHAPCPVLLAPRRALWYPGADPARTRPAVRFPAPRTSREPRSVWSER
jgi:nucleotide-binding universal stress UspA family protein